MSTSEAQGVVKSLELIGSGPVGLIHAHKMGIKYKKPPGPTLTNGHRLVHAGIPGRLIGAVDQETVPARGARPAAHRECRFEPKTRDGISHRLRRGPDHLVERDGDCCIIAGGSQSADAIKFCFRERRCPA